MIDGHIIDIKNDYGPKKPAASLVRIKCANNIEKKTKATQQIKSKQRKYISLTNISKKS